MSAVTEQPKFTQPIEADLAQLEQTMIGELSAYNEDLIAAATHLMKAGGKRLRPVMSLLCARATHPEPQELLSRSHHLLAIAVEVLHTATLIHDDIIDKASTRRGLPTVNSQWGERTSVLTGDFLLARSCYYVSVIEKTKLNTIFSQMVMDMCNGEMNQLNRRYKSQVTLEQYLEQIASKTAILMAVGCQGAGIINDAPLAIETALYEYGRCVGMAFQIMDDVLDFSASDEELGKPAYNDLIQGQVTLPTLLALRSSPHQDELRALIDDGLDTEAAQQRAIALVLDSTGQSESLAMADAYVAQAITHLDALPPSPAREALAELAHFAARRRR